MTRAAFRARGPDGRTFVWQARRSVTGSGEERRGLRFDLAIVPR